jgi:Sec-independent protein translocase protein TatA
MGAFSIVHWLIVLGVVVMIFGRTRHKQSTYGWLQSRMRSLQTHTHDGADRMPVYSAETTKGKEAEFIRDRLPTQFPPLVALVVVAILGAVMWWITR